jgi:nucleoside-diphosphate-sugar epimerase
MPALLPNSKILITGVTGYIGLHIALAALERGHSVRGVVRSTEKGETLRAYLEKAGFGSDGFDYVVVTDFTQPSAYEEALKGPESSLPLFE